MLPINRLPIKTRSEDVFPHVRSRWVRAGGTSWAHQAPSITLWQEPLEHGGASVEPQVKCVGWAVFLMHSKGMYGCHICIQALYVSHTTWHVDTHYTCTCCMCARTSHLPHAPPVSWGQAEPTTCTTPKHSVWENFHPSDMFHPCTRDLCLCTIQVWTENKRWGKNDACDFDNR